MGVVSAAEANGNSGGDAGRWEGQMADASQDKPDLTNGIPEGDLADGAMLDSTNTDAAPTATLKTGREEQPKTSSSA